MIESFPLYWPVGYKRTLDRIDSRFKITMGAAQKFLYKEIERLNAKDLIVSTNVPVRKDGMLYADWMNRKMNDSGVAIYFKYNNQDVVMCCDQYKKVWENLYALGKGIEAIRSMERWGVSDFITRAFTGFKAIGNGIKEEYWFQVLGVLSSASEETIRAAYREKIKLFHPDKGGDDESFYRIQKAYTTGIEELKNKK